MKNKRKILAMFVAVMMIASQSTLFAAVAGTAGPFQVSASVSTASSFGATIYRNNPCPTLVNCLGPDFSRTFTSMTFGQLAEKTFVSQPDPITGKTKTFKEMRSEDNAGSGAIGGFSVVLTANTHQVPYQIRQNATSLTSAAITLPTGACTMTPIYADDDNGGTPKPATATVGPTGPWLGDRLVYNSGPGGNARAVQAIYGISGLDPTAGGTAAIPIDQPLGTYTGTVTFTLTT